MKVIEPSHKILFMMGPDECLNLIELAGRTCYKSEHKISDDSAWKFVRGIVRSGHHSVIEHVNMTVKFVTDRGVSHELVRHRLASYSQESTRYCSYDKKQFGGELTFIRPSFWAEGSREYGAWLKVVQIVEKTYLNMVRSGVAPQEARSILPNSLKTEIVMTANLREWRHIFKLRCSKAAHPQIRELLKPLLGEMFSLLPEVFSDVALDRQKKRGEDCKCAMEK